MKSVWNRLDSVADFRRVLITVEILPISRDSTIAGTIITDLYHSSHICHSGESDQGLIGKFYEEGLFFVPGYAPDAL